LIRERANCEALAIEFENDPKIVGNCMDTLRLMADIASVAIANIDKQIAKTQAKIEKTGLLSDEEVFGVQKTPNTIDEFLKDAPNAKQPKDASPPAGTAKPLTPAEGVGEKHVFSAGLLVILVIAVLISAAIRTGWRRLKRRRSTQQ